MFLLPVVMRKHAILLRQHAAQTLGSAKICTRLACFVRTRSGDGAAYGVPIPAGMSLSEQTRSDLLDAIMGTTGVPFPVISELDQTKNVRFIPLSSTDRHAYQHPAVSPSEPGWHIVIEFDRPQTISRLVYEVEETRPSAPKKCERTQEVRVEASEDGGRSCR